MDEDDLMWNEDDGGDMDDQQEEDDPEVQIENQYFEAKGGTLAQISVCFATNFPSLVSIMPLNTADRCC
jgi:hypothetical protein